MPIVRSLRARVVLWVSVALTLLLAVTIVGLDTAFRGSTDRAVAELLQAQLLGLIALAEETSEGNLTLRDENLNPQFSLTDSGIYGTVWDADGVPTWRSASLLDSDLAVQRWPAPGEQYHVRLAPHSGLPELEMLVMGVTWEFAEGYVLPYTFGVAVSMEPYATRQAAFRRNLTGWFVGVTVTLVLVLAGLLRFVLRPLRRLESEVREVEVGERSRLSTELPTELVGLAGNLNTLIDTERRRLTRYRHTLDDLAHSLKTPLAALRTLLAETRSGGAPGQGEAFARELDRMDQRVSYQLRRARAGGATGFGVEPLPIEPIVHDLVTTLDKVYRDKGVSCELEIAPRAVFRGDAGDLSEILGNLLDNAYKYCKRSVLVTVATTADGVDIRVGDDGPGISAAITARLFERGARADESVPGQGIGLAVVRETVELYHGALTVGRSALGGAEIGVSLGRAGA
ncbi:MAG TPA: ATP-binding protein [Gammaproteobacteria bacterium]|jgi:two-component system sensor histidine kinase PhoQ